MSKMTNDEKILFNLLLVLMLDTSINDNEFIALAKRIKDLR